MESQGIMDMQLKAGRTLRFKRMTAIFCDSKDVSGAAASQKEASDLPIADANLKFF